MATPFSRNLSMVSVSIASNLSDVSYVDMNLDNTTLTAPPPSPEVSTANRTEDVEEHAEHYYPNGNVKFLIENTLYQLHSDVLEPQSSWYREYRANAVHDVAGTLPPGWRALSTPVCTIYVHHGQEKVQVERPSLLEDRTGAIVLEGVTVEEMDAFLAVLYTRDYITFGLTTLDQWKAVLKVASKWECPAIRVLAIDRLERGLGVALTPFDRLILARKHGIESWVAPALAGLVVRSAPLGPEEILQMLPEDIARVGMAREENALLRWPPSAILASAPEPEFFEQTAEPTARPESFTTARPSSPDSDIELQVLVAASDGLHTDVQNTEDLHTISPGHSRETGGVVLSADPLPNSTQEDTPGENRADTPQGNELTRPRRDSTGLRTLTLPARYSSG